jgi:hypothetical protein
MSQSNAPRSMTSSFLGFERTHPKRLSSVHFQVQLGLGNPRGTFLLPLPWCLRVAGECQVTIRTPRGSARLAVENLELHVMQATDPIYFMVIAGRQSSPEPLSVPDDFSIFIGLWIINRFGKCSGRTSSSGILMSGVHRLQSNFSFIGSTSPP